MRLIRDINVNSSDRFCMDNITISDYIPDYDGRLSNLKQEICHTNRTDLFKELPLLMIASQVSINIFIRTICIPNNLDNNS